MKQTKILGLAILLILSAIGIAAFCEAKTDVLYIVDKQADIEPTFLQAINETGLNYSIYTDDSLAGVNFSDYYMILVDNDAFSNSKAIPINQYPAVIINRLNLKTWGWSYLVSQAILPAPYTVINMNTSSLITKGLNQTNIQVYNTTNRKVLYIDDDYAYKGLNVVVAPTWDNKDAVIATARNGTTLISQNGQAPTVIKANSVFFGISDAKYWTPESKLLFVNSMKWAMDNDEDGLYGRFENPAPDFINVNISPAVPTKGATITVSSKIFAKTVTNMTVFYTVNDGNLQSVPMMMSQDLGSHFSMWNASIGSFNAGDNVTYYVFGSSTDNQNTSANYSFTVGNEISQIDIQLNQGYNLISVPVMTASQAKGDIFSNVGTVKTLNGNILSDVPTLSPGIGYFVFADNAHKETITGSVPLGIQTVNLNQGMNLVGIMGGQGSKQALSSLPSQVIEVSKRNADGTYTVATYYQDQGWYPSFDLESGKGYWMKSSASAAWQYTP